MVLFYDIKEGVLDEEFYNFLRFHSGIFSRNNGEKPFEVVIQAGHYQGGIDHIESITYSPEGKFLASAGGNDQNVVIWHMQSGKELRRFDIGVYVDKVRFSKNGKYIAVKSYSKDRQYKDTIKLWNIETGNVNTLQFSRDDTYLISGNDRTVRIWDVKNGNYDFSSKKGRLIAVRRGLDVFDIEEFAAQYNRTDLIMERLGF